MSEATGWPGIQCSGMPEKSKCTLRGWICTGPGSTSCSNRRGCSMEEVYGRHNVRVSFARGLSICREWPESAMCWSGRATRWCHASRRPISTSAIPTTSATSCRVCGCWRRCTSGPTCAAWTASHPKVPVLLVGNHSGGNVPPDTFVFTLAFWTYFGVERPFYQLAHNLVVSAPPTGIAAQVRHRSPPTTTTPSWRCKSGAALPGVPRWRLRGVPPVVGAPLGRLRRSQGLRASSPARPASRSLPSVVARGSADERSRGRTVLMSARAKKNSTDERSREGRRQST